MAIRLIKDDKREWTCLSSDEKPTVGVPNGSTIHAVDSGDEWIFHDGTWEKDKRLARALGRI